MFFIFWKPIRCAQQLRRRTNEDNFVLKSPNCVTKASTKKIGKTFPFVHLFPGWGGGSGRVMVNFWFRLQIPFSSGEMGVKCIVEGCEMLFFGISARLLKRFNSEKKMANVWFWKGNFVPQRWLRSGGKSKRNCCDGSAEVPKADSVGNSDASLSVYTKVVSIDTGWHFVRESDALFWNSAETGVFSGSLWDDRVQNHLASSICCREWAENVKAYMSIPKDGYTLIAKYAKTIAKCKKQKVYSGVFCITFFTFCVPFFVFRILRQGRHSCENSKDFVVYFFPALIKHKIRMKCECIVRMAIHLSQNMQKWVRNAKKRKVYSRVLCATLFVFHDLFLVFCISQHFAPGSAFAWKLKGFCGLFFRGINEMRKVYSECFIFHSVFREKHSQNAKSA